MFVFSNLATSLDGKIATKSRALYHLGTAADRRQMQVLRRRCDVVLMGASTLRTSKSFCGISGAREQPANAVLSSRLEGISSGWSFFANASRRRILFVTGRVPTARRRLFEHSCEIITLEKQTKRRPIAVQIVSLLERSGFRRLLIEGGGNLMWDFVSLNLIDEYHVTLTPKIIGGSGAPTLVEGEGFDPPQVLNLKLVHCRRLGDELYLTYRRRAHSR